MLATGFDCVCINQHLLLAAVPMVNPASVAAVPKVNSNDACFPGDKAYTSEAECCSKVFRTNEQISSGVGESKCGAAPPK